MIYEYTLKYPHLDFDVDSYMSLVRYLIYYNEENLAPSSVQYENNVLEVINPEILAQRLGLIMFKPKVETLDLTKFYAFEIENPTDQVMAVYTSDLKNEFVEPINMEQMIFQVPSNFKSVLKINFEWGVGSTHARFSRIEGYRLDSKTKTINFQLNSAKFDETWSKVLNYVDLLNL